MFRRIIFIGGGLTLAAVLLFGRHASSYFRTSLGWVKDCVKSSVPLEFEIDRARKLVTDLVPDIRKNMHSIAQEEVELERLSKQIAQTEEKLAKDKVDLMRLKTDVDSNHESLQYNGRTYTVAQVKTDLSNRFERYKTSDATLASLREIQRAREQSLVAAKQKLDGMLVEKRKLEVDVENLEARLKMVEVAQTTSSFNFDDSQLGQAKELVTDLRTRLDVEEKVAQTDSKYLGEIPLEESAPANVAEEVGKYFSPESGSGKVAKAEK